MGISSDIIALEAQIAEESNRISSPLTPYWQIGGIIEIINNLQAAKTAKQIELLKTQAIEIAQINAEIAKQNEILQANINSTLNNLTDLSDFLSEYKKSFKEDFKKHLTKNHNFTEAQGSAVSNTLDEQVQNFTAKFDEQILKMKERAIAFAQEPSDENLHFVSGRVQVAGLLSSIAEKISRDIKEHFSDLKDLTPEQGEKLKTFLEGIEKSGISLESPEAQESILKFYEENMPSKLGNLKSDLKYISDANKIISDKNLTPEQMKEQLENLNKPRKEEADQKQYTDGTSVEINTALINKSNLTKEQAENLEALSKLQNIKIDYTNASDKMMSRLENNGEKTLQLPVTAEIEGKPHTYMLEFNYAKAAIDVSSDGNFLVSPTSADFTIKEVNETRKFSTLENQKDGNAPTFNTAIAESEVKHEKNSFAYAAKGLVGVTAEAPNTKQQEEVKLANLNIGRLSNSQNVGLPNIDLDKLAERFRENQTQPASLGVST
jgi:hypothetical protein